LSTYPNVAIVGRTNVGKSTLFNRITRGKQSIVFAREGVTRDYIQEIVTWNDKSFNLIDTGGLPLTRHADQILEEVEQSVLSIIENADLILFVCDGKNGLIEQDRKLAKILHKTKKPVFLVLNKSDNITAFQEHEHEFYALGFKPFFPISAVHGTGVNDLLDAVTEIIETRPSSLKAKIEPPSYKITILGKPNVGKSSLLNLLVKEQRAIVSEVAGTTREAITQKIAFHKDVIQLTDTPGVRRKAKITDPLEQIMVKSALQAVRAADIVLVMIDSTQGHLADQELKLLFYAYEEKKSIILLLNKTDILDETKKDTLNYDMKRYDFFMQKIPIIWISCKTEKNIGRVFKEIQKAQIRRQQKFDGEKVNELLKSAFIKKPMYHKRQLLKLLNVKSIKTERSVPTFVLYVNYPQWFGPTQLGFIENQLRKKYDLLGCPIQFILQKV
jgi:GTP-binding protein